uniref:Protein kinase domain-containing protein n=1 Tax=Arcella intermedia TaxID=1963864 RepID=A0A6B2L6X7_9EUKA
MKSLPSDERRHQFSKVEEELSSRYSQFTPIVDTKTSIVYLAHDRHTNSRCIVKHLNESFIRSGERQRAALLEFKIASQLVHPNIVRYETYIHCGAFVYFQMEYCALGSLDTYIRNNPLRNNGSEKEEFWFLALDILLGLSYIHKKQFVHLDMKPANIFLVPKSSSPIPSAKIGDFGLSTSVGLSRHKYKKYKKGDGRYIAPELFDKAKPVTQLADIYSLGITFIEMAGDFIPSLALWEEILQKDGEIDAADYGISEHLSSLLSRMLRKDPDCRDNALSLFLFSEKLQSTAEQASISVEAFDESPQRETNANPLSPSIQIFSESDEENEQSDVKENSGGLVMSTSNSNSSCYKTPSEPAFSTRFQQNSDSVKKRLEF